MDQLARKAASSTSTISGSWRPQSADIEGRSVELTWTTGADVRRVDPFTREPYVERLRVDRDAVDLSRLQAGAPLLDSHAQDGVRSQLGVVEGAWVDGGRGYARVRFSERHADIFADVVDGILRNVSVGYTRNRETDLNTLVDGIPVREVTRWTPHELSLVTVPADQGAQIRRRELDNMTTQKTATAKDDAKEARAELVAEINDTVAAVGLPTSFARKLIAEGISLDECRKRVINAIADKSDDEIDHRVTPGDGMRESTFASKAADALLHRGRLLDTEDPESLHLASRSLVDLARMAAEMDGKGIPATAGRGEIATRAITTSTLTSLVANVAERSAALGYEAEPRRFLALSREVAARNFSAIERVKLSDAPALALIAEGADYTEGTLSDTQESYSLAKYGKYLAFTREMLLADDLDELTRVPRMLGAAAAAKENDVFWGVHTSNGNLSDARAIYNGTDGNTVVGGVTAAVLEAARVHLAAQSTESGVKLALEPAFLVCGPDLRTDVEKLVRPPVSYSNTTLANALTQSLQESLTLVVEPRVPAGTFFVMAANNRIDTCEHAYLEGVRGPFVTREDVFINDTIRLKVTLDFGAAVIDRRGLYRVEAS